MINDKIIGIDFFKNWYDVNWTGCISTLIISTIKITDKLIKLFI